MSFKGQVYPRLDSSTFGEPINKAVKLGFKSAGSGPSTTISVIDGACDVVKLVFVPAGGIRYVNVFTGQTMLVDTSGYPAGTGPGWFPPVSPPAVVWSTSTEALSITRQTADRSPAWPGRRNALSRRGPDGRRSARAG